MMLSFHPTEIDESHLQFVRIVWCDNGSILRAKAVSWTRFREYLKHGTGISEAQQAVTAIADVPISSSGLGCAGEVRLVPDMSTFTVLPYSPSHARVMGDMVRDGKPWPLCPREFLRRMAAAAQTQDLQIEAAFENEFYLLKSYSFPLVPVDNTPFASTASMDIHAPVIGAICRALEAQGMTIEQYYPKSGPGQQEISILHANSVKAADNQVAFRETVNAIARQHGLASSFVPKLFSEHAGSGCHLHLSLWRDGGDIVSDGSGGLSKIARAFAAGILDHLPALMALTAPSTNSYRRIRPSCWSGAFRCWGFDNREAALRVPTNPEPAGPTNLELKTVDATSNPYLALGATIAAGLDGIRKGLDLPDPVQVDPAVLPPEERDRLGIDLLPQNLGVAIEALEDDEVLLTALGPGLSRAFLAVRKAEWEALGSLDHDAEVPFLLERY